MVITWTMAKCYFVTFEVLISVETTSSSIRILLLDQLTCSTVSLWNYFWYAFDFSLCSDCKSFKDKIEEITESLSKDSGESAEADATADLIEKLSVEEKGKEEKTEAKEEPAPKEEKKDETEKQEKSGDDK